MRLLRGQSFAIINGPRDRDAQLHADAVKTLGGAYSLRRLSVLSKFFKAEKNFGCFQNTDDYWGLWGENPTQALTSLKQRRLATAVNSPVFTPDRGSAGDGAASYIDTGFNPSSHALAMTGTNLRIGVYERTALSLTSAYAAGTLGVANQNLSMNPRRAGSGASQFGVNASVIGAVVASSLGFTAGSRNGSTYAHYKNGSSVGDPGTPGVVTSVLAPRSIFIHAFNNNGLGPAGLRATSVGFVVVGAALSATQELAQYNAVQALATDVGAAV